MKIKLLTIIITIALLLGFTNAQSLWASHTAANYAVYPKMIMTDGDGSPRTPFLFLVIDSGGSFDIDIIRKDALVLGGAEARYVFTSKHLNKLVAIFKVHEILERSLVPLPSGTMGAVEVSLGFHVERRQLLESRTPVVQYDAEGRLVAQHEVGANQTAVGQVIKHPPVPISIGHFHGGGF